MTTLNNYLQDGANYQAKCVLFYLQNNDSLIESSWNDEFREYDAEVNISRWENCREQGYVLMLKNKKSKQLNIAFFEHRNSDNICAIKWHENTINAPTIESANFNGECYSNDKYDTSFSVLHMQIQEIGDWIKEQFINHWESALSE